MDSQIFERVNGLAGHNPVLDGLLSFLAGYGPLLLVAAFVALWFWPGPRPWRDRWQRSAVLAAGSALIALGVNQVISRAWFRPRPFTHHTALLLLPASHDPSFPSDHAAFAFAVATVLLLTSRRLGGPALVYAAVVAFSRVFVGEHYPTDVVAGALVGAGVALGIFALRGRLEPVLGPLLRTARKMHLA